MSTLRANIGFNSGCPRADAGAEQQSGMWRPWTGQLANTAAQTPPNVNQDVSMANQTKVPQFVHPVKLFWPKGRCFDYLYQDAEMLLRNYPVQATICLYEDSSSEEDDDDDDDDYDDDEEEEVEEGEAEETGKELN